MRLSAHLQGLEVQAWAKSGLGEKPYKPRKYGTGRVESDDTVDSEEPQGCHAKPQSLIEPQI